MGGAESVQSNEKYNGFRIYKLIPNGPLEKSNLKIIDDFIIPPEELFLKKIPFCDWVKEKADQTIKLQIYSLSKRAIKEIEIKVNPIGSPEGFLGGSVRFENYQTAQRKVLHVLKVKDNFFAKEKLGLTPFEDYLIALRPNKGDILTLNKAIGNPLELFSEMIKVNLGKECEFYIYNKTKGGRCVNAKIIGDGSFELGCDVAYGKLHEFPFDEDDMNEETKKLREEMGEMQNI